MSKVPYFGGIHRIPPGSYNEGYPLSVYRALAMRNNIQFCVDQITQHRINIVGPPFNEAGYDGILVDTNGEPARTFIWSHNFEWTWIRQDWGTALDVDVVAVVGDGGGDDLGMTVRVVPASAPFNDPTAGGALFVAGGTTVGVGTTVHVSGLYVPNYAGVSPDKASVFEQHAIDENGVRQTVLIAKLRIEVVLNVPADDYGAIESVLVREFAWHHEAP